MDGAAGLESGQLGQIEGFRHQALAGESRVAVNQERQPLLPFRVAEQVLLGPDPPFHHRIDRF